MTKNTKTYNKNIILFVGTVNKRTTEEIRKYAKENKQQLRIALLYDKNDHKKESGNFEGIDIAIPCNTYSPKDIDSCLFPYKKELLAVTARSESNLIYFQRIIPHVQDVVCTPSQKSIEMTTNKIEMRRCLQSYDKSITPPFILIEDVKKATLKKIEEKVGFPLIVKPAKMASSLLISICYYQEELDKTLKEIFKRASALQEKYGIKDSDLPILAEHFMEGETYSFGAYINNKAEPFFCPLVHIKTGKQVGFDDFFSYQQITPVDLQKEDIQEAENVAKKALKALDLRCSGAYIELIKTEDGWKIVELGPRIGGWRNDMYMLSYGINHSINDILVRFPLKPHIPKKVKQHTAVLQFYAKKEGRISKILGIRKVKNLESFYSIILSKKIGDIARFAKNGGKPICKLILSNKSKSKLLADIRRTEQCIKISTSR